MRQMKERRRERGRDEDKYKNVLHFGMINGLELRRESKNPDYYDQGLKKGI